MAGDYQLLHTARDYFHFATNFLEPINLSATHIYHSALELSPLSSIVRKVYYTKRPCHSPRVVTGVSDSWKPSTAVSTKHTRYLSSAWSPCAKFVAVVAETAVEIWDALTLKLLSTMQSPTVDTRFKGGIAYSQDGHSLAGCSGDAIIIWDTQTGGVAKEIKCKGTHDGLEIVWSLDGNTIGAISQGGWKTMTMCTYNFTSYNAISGTTLSSEPLQSGGKPCLWAHGNCFQITTIAENDKGCTMDIFEVGIILVKIKSFHFQCSSTPGPFSPSTYRLSIPDSKDQNHNPELLVLDIHTSRVLLQAKGSYQNPCFSPDGELFTASTKNHLSVWRYTPDGYTQWKEIQQNPIKPQFSPTLSSIFGYAGGLLCVLHLDYSLKVPVPITKSVTAAHGKPLDAFSPHGTFIATAYHKQSTVTITKLNSPNPFPSQFIDTDLVISEIALTGNVLLVNSSDTIVGWLLTEDGEVDGILGNTRADQNDSLWTVSPQNMDPILLERLKGQYGSEYLEFSVKDEIAAIRYIGFIIHAYHIRTGEVIKPANISQYQGLAWYCFNNPLGRGDCNLYHHQYQKVPEHNWLVSETALKDGWVKDPEGNHRLWLHPHWRPTANKVDWLDKVTTLRLRNPSELVVIKF